MPFVHGSVGVLFMVLSRGYFSQNTTAGKLSSLIANIETTANALNFGKMIHKHCIFTLSGDLSYSYFVFALTM